MIRPTALALAVLAIAGCGDPSTPSRPLPGSPEPATTAPAPAEGCADVVAAEAIRADDGTYRFDVTVSSPDTGWDKYADAWEVVAPDGTVLGTRVLTHPHVDEQPFTRSLSGAAVPPGVDQVVVRARDSVAGFCGAEVTVTLTGGN